MVRCETCPLIKKKKIGGVKMFIVEWKVEGKDFLKEFIKFSEADFFYDDLIIEMIADFKSVFLYQFEQGIKKSLY